MDVVMIFKYGKRFRYAPSFNKYVTKIFFGFFFFAKIVAANFNSLPNKLNFCCRNYVRKYGRHIVQKVHIIDVTKKNVVPNVRKLVNICFARGPASIP